MRTSPFLGAIALAACAAGAAPNAPVTPSSPSDAGPAAVVAAPNAARGELPPEHMVEVVASRADDVRACYEKGLERDAKLAGRLVVALTIAEDGAVERAIQAPGADAITDVSVVACALDVLRGLRFQRPRGGKVELVAPFAFKVKEEDAGR